MPDLPEVEATTAPKAAKAAKKKAAKKKAAPAKATKPAATPAKAKGDLTGNEVKVLTSLKGTEPGGKMLTRAQLAEKTGIAKGWSKMLGSATKDDLGMSGDDSLEGRGFIKSAKPEEGRGLLYAITAKGKAALEKAKAS